MNRTADNLIDVTWVAWCAERLREQWPRLDGATLEETARELWADETLRVLGPRQAAENWLALGMPEPSFGLPNGSAVHADDHAARAQLTNATRPHG
jgi:hypothetical protein